MKVYIQTDARGFPHHYDFFKAYKGFQEFGAEFSFFETPNGLEASQPQDIVVGYVGIVANRLRELHFTVPVFDYPDELSKYLGRKMWRSTINTINSHPEMWPVFVKSEENKKITGVLVQAPKDLEGCGDCYSDEVVLCSEPIELVTEWRCFVRYGHILDVRHYKGDWRTYLDFRVVEQAVKDFVTAPAGYAMDMGLTKEGKTVLIEVNEGYALGSYGLFYVDYAKLLSARWAELTGTEDELNF
jgi:hypothetical protein